MLFTTMSWASILRDGHRQHTQHDCLGHQLFKNTLTIKDKLFHDSSLRLPTLKLRNLRLGF